MDLDCWVQLQAAVIYANMYRLQWMSTVDWNIIERLLCQRPDNMELTFW